MKRNLTRVLSPSLAVSALALFVAIGSGAALASGGLATPKPAGPGTYHFVGSAGVPFLNGWKNYPRAAGFARARYYKDSSGIVHLEGVVRAGTPSSVVFRLPRGFRPQLNHAWAVAAGVGGAVAEDIDVFANGDVFATGPANDAVALDGVSFRTR